MSADCILCGQVEGDANRNDLATLIDAPWTVRPVLAENNAAVVMPSIGALVPGHVLVCPARHYRSLVAAPPDVARDVLNLLRTTQRRTQELTGTSAHIFEHGSSLDGCRVACSVEHAHIHVVPSAVDIRSTVAAMADWRPASDNIEDLRSEIGSDEYLYYAAPTGERLVARTRDGFPSQLMRRVLADGIGVADWNWRTDPAVDRINATADLLLETALV